MNKPDEQEISIEEIIKDSLKGQFDIPGYGTCMLFYENYIIPGRNVFGEIYWHFRNSRRDVMVFSSMDSLMRPEQPWLGGTVFCLYFVQREGHDEEAKLYDENTKAWAELVEELKQ